jgi:hypothetical protein
LAVYSFLFGVRRETAGGGISMRRIERDGVVVSSVKRYNRFQDRILSHFHRFSENYSTREWAGVTMSGEFLIVKYNFLLLSIGGGECEYDAITDCRVVATNSNAQMMSSKDVISFFNWEVDKDQVW